MYLLFRQNSPSHFLFNSNYPISTDIKPPLLVCGTSLHLNTGIKLSFKKKHNNNGAEF